VVFDIGLSFLKSFAWNVDDSGTAFDPVHFCMSLDRSALSLERFIDSFGIRVGYPCYGRGLFDREALIVNKAAQLFSLVVAQQDVSLYHCGKAIEKE
jgi:hypothetical protein